MDSPLENRSLRSENQKLLTSIGVPNAEIVWFWPVWKDPESHSIREFPKQDRTLVSGKLSLNQSFSLYLMIFIKFTVTKSDVDCAYFYDGSIIIHGWTLNIALLKKMNSNCYRVLLIKCLYSDIRENKG